MITLEFADWLSTTPNTIYAAVISPKNRIFIRGLVPLEKHEHLLSPENRRLFPSEILTVLHEEGHLKDVWPFKTTLTDKQARKKLQRLDHEWFVETNLELNSQLLNND